MKKEARNQAEKMFLKAGGKITNREIAQAVGVNPLTVGRWKRDEGWEDKLKAGPDESAESAPVVRKKEARDKAFNLYMKADGNITNKSLADAVNVSPATISKWKEMDEWMGRLESAEPETTVVTAEAEAEAEPPEEAPEEPEDQGLRIGQLASPDQIVKVNARIDAMLERDHLTAAEVADLAAAKRDLLDAVDIYVSMVRELGDF